MTRIIDFFPSDHQDHVRSSLADCLQGIVCQTLCRGITTGRVVASEVLSVNNTVSNLIREEKANQIVSAMQTGKPQGHQLLNEDLANLVKQDKMGYKEALSKTPDPQDLARRLHKRLPKD